MHTKHPRGRPVNSGIDDSRFLNEVADLLLVNSRLLPTTAMRRVMQTYKGVWVAHSEAAMLRRLQDKWKTQKIELAAGALRRQQLNTPSLTIEDVIEFGIAMRGAYYRIMTPENVEKAIFIVNAVNERIQEIAEPLLRLKQHPAFQPENLQKIAAIADRVRAVQSQYHPVAQRQLR